MKSKTLSKKVQILMVKRGYGFPGGKTAIGEELGLTPAQISKALHGTYSEEHAFKILHLIYSYLLGKATLRKEN